MAYEFKKLSDVNAIEAVSANTNVLVEENGEIVKVAANSMVPTGVVKSVNGNEPDENGNVQMELPQGFSGSWNDLTDKPFGDDYIVMTTITEDTIGHPFVTDWNAYWNIGEDVYNAFDQYGLDERKIKVTLTFQSGEIIPYEDIILYDENSDTYTAGNYNDVIAGERGFGFEFDPYGGERLDIWGPAGLIEAKVELMVLKEISRDYLPGNVPFINKAERGQLIAVQAINDDGSPWSWTTTDFKFPFYIVEHLDKPESEGGTIVTTTNMAFGELLGHYMMETLGKIVLIKASSEEPEIITLSGCDYNPEELSFSFIDYDNWLQYTYNYNGQISVEEYGE